MNLKDKVALVTGAGQRAAGVALWLVLCGGFCGCGDQKGPPTPTPTSTPAPTRAGKEGSTVKRITPEFLLSIGFTKERDRVYVKRNIRLGDLRASLGFELKVTRLVRREEGKYTAAVPLRGLEFGRCTMEFSGEWKGDDDAVVNAWVSHIPPAPRPFEGRSGPRR